KDTHRAGRAQGSRAPPRRMPGEAQAKTSADGALAPLKSPGGAGEPAKPRIKEFDGGGVEALRRQVIALQRISSLGVLAGGVFHELNNAMTPILNYAKLALRNPDPAYRERALGQIAEAAQRAATITR